VSLSLDDLADHQLVARRVQEPGDNGFEHLVQALYRTATGQALMSTRSTIVGPLGPVSDERRLCLSDWSTGATWILGLAPRDGAFNTPRSWQVSVLTVPDELRHAIEGLAALGSTQAAAFLAGLGHAPR
jgi:hypothetical protein